MNELLEIRNFYHEYPLRATIIACCILIYVILKGRGGLIYPLSADGRQILKLSKHLKRKYGLSRDFSLWNVLSASDHSIKLSGAINKNKVEVILSNQRIVTSNAEIIDHAKKYLNTDVKHLMDENFSIYVKFVGRKATIINMEELKLVEIEKVLNQVA